MMNIHEWSLVLAWKCKDIQAPGAPLAPNDLGAAAWHRSQGSSSRWPWGSSGAKLLLKLSQWGRSQADANKQTNKQPTNQPPNQVPNQPTNHPTKQHRKDPIFECPLWRSNITSASATFTAFDRLEPLSTSTSWSDHVRSKAFKHSYKVFTQTVERPPKNPKPLEISRTPCFPVSSTSLI